MLVSAIPDGKLPTWDDPFGGTDDEHMFEAGMAMSRDNYKIGFAIGCDIGDYFKGHAYSYNHFLQELRFNRLIRQFTQFHFQRLNRETLADRDESQVHWTRMRLDRVKQRDILITSSAYISFCSSLVI
ncbi:MAG: hypothetical protein WBL40_15080 [Terrimicrobiaceae bacterium]